MSASLTHQRLALWLLGVFAGIAMALASIGIYGVMAYLVSQRAAEIGVRMALGASVSDVLQMILRHGMGLALMGVGLGLVSAMGVTRFLKSQLYGITPTDPATFFAVASILAVVALAACLIPARRAAQVDPAVALRYE